MTPYLLSLRPRRRCQIRGAATTAYILVLLGAATKQLVLMDVQMPELDGCEAARQIRQLPRRDASSVPILALTGNSSSDDVEAAMQAGMNDYMVKPVKMKLLARVMSEYIHV